MKRIANATLAILLASLAGCFDNKAKPQDVSTVTNLVALAALDAPARAALGRAVLRGTTEPLPSGFLAGLDALVTLDISECNLEDIPPEVFSLPRLREFYASRNALKSVPDALFAVPGLEYVNLDANLLSSIPDGIAAAKSLKWLRLNTNTITSLPASLAELKSLRRLYLRGNRLSAVPETIRELPELEALLLDGNRSITTLPDWITALPSLRSIGLGATGIRKLPDDLEGWKNLDSLTLYDCPISQDERKRIRKALPDVAIVF